LAAATSDEELRCFASLGLGAVSDRRCGAPELPAVDDAGVLAGAAAAAGVADSVAALSCSCGTFCGAASVPVSQRGCWRLPGRCIAAAAFLLLRDFFAGAASARVAVGVPLQPEQVRHLLPPPSSSSFRLGRRGVGLVRRSSAASDFFSS